MRFFKLGIVSIFILFILATSIGLLLPSKVIVSRATNITASKDSLLHLIQDIHQWKLWVNGMSGDKINILTPTHAWLNETEVTITSIHNDEIESKWVGKNGTTQQSLIRIIQNANSSNVVVQWQFIETLQWYPWQRFGSLVNEAVMGTQLENNLANLKKIAEE